MMTIVLFMRGILYLFMTLGALLLLNQPFITQNVHDGNTLLLIAIGIVFIGSFAVFYLANATRIPSFVIAIAIGLASSHLLGPLTSNANALTILVGISATLILFSGGLEMPFERFRKIAAPTLLLSIIGVVASMMLFGYALFTTGPALNTPVAFGIALLLGAVLSSTDPTVLIPMMKQLRFRVPKIKDLIIAESAVTDVSGALLAILLLEILRIGGISMTAPQIFSQLFSVGTGISLLGHTVLGILFGVLGAGLLVVLAKLKTQDSREYDVDAAFFLFVPIIIYTLANAVGGSGFLAAFIAGLLFQTTDFLHETERFFNHIIDGFVKPSIFILLGAIVPLTVLIEYAPIGIAIALCFIFIIRPLVVFLSLLPMHWMRRQRLALNELLGLAIVRETGAVPAVLIISLVAIPNIGSDLFLAIGLWVIIVTVMILPAITPWVFEKLKLAERMPQNVSAKICDQEEPFIILASRGGSFGRRLPEVTEWAINHHIHRVCLLLCLEDKYSKDMLKGRLERAQSLFTEIKHQQAREGHKIAFFTVTTDGYLHDAIESIPSETSHAVAVFVGKRMLDFHLEEIQKLGVPLYFID